MDVLSIPSRLLAGVLGVIVVVAGAATGLPRDAQAQSPPSEYEIKAAFLYNFVKFVDWPSQALPETSDTVTVCVLSDDPSWGALESIRGKTVKGRRLSIRRIEPLKEKEVQSCHVLFMSSSEEKRLPEVMQHLHGSSVLTVGEMERFIQSGGIINFVIEKNKIRFEINLTGAEQARLKLSSQLLSLAKVVRQ
jgi:hypothetical protein